MAARRALGCVAVLSTLASVACAQGVLLESGTHGIGTVAAFAVDEHTETATGGLGFSYAGRIDVEVDYVNTVFERSSRTEIRPPVVTAYLGKQSDDRPLTAALRFGYWRRSDTYVRDGTEYTTEHEMTRYGAFVYRAIRSAPRLRLIHELGIRFEFERARSRDFLDRPIRERSGSLSVVAGVTFDVELGARMHLTPRVSIDVDDEQNGTYAVGLGFVHEL